MAPAEDRASSQSPVSLRRIAAVAYGLLEDLENGVLKAHLLKTEQVSSYSMQQLENGFIAISFIPHFRINKKSVALDLIKILILGMNG
jgi:hypothetical protein